MSQLIVRHGWSDAYRSAQFVATGQMPPATTETRFEAETLTEAQRAAWVEAVGAAEQVTLHAPGTRAYDNKLAQANAPLTIEAAIAGVRRQQDEWRTADLAQLTRRRDEGIAKLRKALAKHNPREGHSVTQADEREADRLGVDISEWLDLAQQYKAANATFWQEENAAEAREAAEREAERMERAAREAAEQVAKLAWAKEHGSDHLRRGLEAGHSCDRLYWIERAAVEYPGYTLDYERNAEHKDRTCPSIPALDARDEVLAAHPSVAATIVWLTDEPSDRKLDDAYRYEFAECEAVRVDDPDYPRYLYKLL